MHKQWLSAVFGFCFAFSTAVISSAQEPAKQASAKPESTKSSPKDTTPYARPAVDGDMVGPAPGSAAGAAGDVSVVRVVDPVVNNTDPNLKNTDTPGDGETSIAINPANSSEIVISAFSSSWAAGNAAIWHSTDDGQTWTKRFTIPLPPGVSVDGCPCDQVFDYGNNNVLFGTFLLGDGNIYTGSTTNPANAGSWTWFLSGGVAQRTNQAATSVGNADQPWMLHNRGTTNSASQNVFVGYDDFGTNPVGMRVNTSINLVPPQFSAAADKLVGTASGAINPGHRLANDSRNGWIYSLHQNCIVNCATLAANPKTIQYILNRSTDQGATWGLNGSATGIVVATADSTQPQPKFGTVNALLGGVLHAAVDPSSGDLYYVYGNRDASGNNRLAIRRISDNGAGGVTVGGESFVVGGTVTAALPSVAVTSNGAIGVFYYTFNGIVSGFPQFTAWLATSTDKGVTFDRQQLATFLSPATDNGDPRQRVLGDYMQVKTFGDCFFGAFTGNGAAFGRSTSNNDPIFFKACARAACVATAKLPDFNADSRRDFPWRNTSSGAVAVWLMNGASIVSASGVGAASSDWKVVATGDLNGDGRSDFIWRHTSGTVAVWFMNGGSVLSTAAIASVGLEWTIAGAGDLNGDGKSDIIFRHNTGAVAVWFMDGATLLSAVPIGTASNEWRLVGIGDLNGDGRSDFVWRNDSGPVAVWLLNGATITSAVQVGGAPSDWHMVAIGDLNGDGRSDLVWRQDSGPVAAWFMDGTTILSIASIGGASTDWHLAAAGDLNGDGRSDVTWRNDSGAVAVWLLNGSAITSIAGIGAAGNDWQIVNGQHNPAVEGQCRG